jgi:hypothetical protein
MQDEKGYPIAIESAVHDFVDALTAFDPTGEAVAIDLECEDVASAGGPFPAQIGGARSPTER